MTGVRTTRARTTSRGIVAALLVCVVLTPVMACTSLHTVQPVTSAGGPVFSDLQTGEIVVVHLRDGRRLQVTVAQVEHDAFVSKEGVRYAYDDIAQVQRRRVDRGKTALAVTGIAFGALAAFYILLAAAVGVLW